MSGSRRDRNIGAVVGGRYRLLERIGRGGNAVVYRARRLGGRPADDVAVKLLVGLASDSAGRFQREAEVIAAIDHPNSLPLFDFGFAADGTPYLVTELLRGSTLADVLEGGPLPQLVVVRMLAQICEVLKVAHGLGIVHRDLKPDNLQVEMLLGDDGTGGWVLVRVIDFGLAHWKSRGTLSDAGSVLGCPRYMSPEQATSRPVDPRTDLYSLGVVAYECLTGAPPFHGGTPLVDLMRQISERPMPLHVHAPYVDAALARLVMQLLEKRPSARPSSARAMREGLRLIERRLEAATPRTRDTEELALLPSAV